MSFIYYAMLEKMLFKKRCHINFIESLGNLFVM